MNPAKLQDDHTEEVRVFVDMAKRYITPLEVKVILELGSRDACEAVSLKRAFRNATVYAFECNPPAIELCRQNIGDKEDIVLVPMAVSDVDGVVDFYAIDPRNTVTTHADGNIGASSLYKANPAYPFEKLTQVKISVPSTTVDCWARKNSVPPADIVWMDLQGAELRALHGMADVLRTIKIIYTEVEFQRIYFGQPLFRSVHRHLRSHGFVLQWISGTDWFGNALYVHKDCLQNLPQRIRCLLTGYLLYFRVEWACLRRVGVSCVRRILSLRKTGT